MELNGLRCPRRLLIVGLFFSLAGQFGCRSSTAPEGPIFTGWDVDRAEVIQWTADDPAFEQDFALEASGLAASSSFLYLPSEKYARVLVVETGATARVATRRLAVPRHAELEGIALTNTGLLFCDEAHATVYEVPLRDEQHLFATSDDPPLAALELTLHGVDVRGGKIGFEGIEVDAADGTVYLLLERSGTPESGCVSRIWSLERSDDGLHSGGDPIEVVLEDCNWRLTGLAWLGRRLIALKTQYPGERYEVVEVDLRSGEALTILDLTDVLRALEREGWSNNVEGLAVAADGALWLVADNAVTGVIDDPEPPRIDHRTLLLRIPAYDASSGAW